MFFRNVRLRNKLCLVAAAQSFIMLLFSIVLVQRQFAQQQAEQYALTNRAMQLSIQALGDQLQRLDERSTEFIGSSAVQDGLARWAQSNALEASDINGTLLNLLHRSYASTYIIRSAELYEASHRYVVSTNIASFSPSDAELLAIWADAAEAMGSQTYHVSAKNPDDVFIARIVRKADQLELSHLGLFITRVRMSNLVRLYATTPGSQERIVILGEDGTVLYDPEGYAPELAPFSQDYIIRAMNGEKMMITAYHSPRNGWQYYCLKPQAAVDAQQRQLLITTALILAALSAAAFAFAALIARQVTQPIGNIIGLMSREGTALLEDVPYQLEARRDELGQLYSGFRAMLEEIQSLIHNNYEIKLAQRDAELHALQAQVNPHLLYNTLNAIQWSARMEGNQTISSVASALGNLLHAALSFAQPTATLREELSLLGDYLVIQRFRFGDRIADTQAIAPNALAALVPKLSLQPIVDNAIVYGTRANPGTTSVHIAAGLVGGQLVIDVTDNGPGIPQDLLEKLKSGDWQPNGTGVGLLNIEERLRLLFGDDAGLQILAAEGGGAHIRMVIPTSEEVRL